MNFLCGCSCSMALAYSVKNNSRGGSVVAGGGAGVEILGRQRTRRRGGSTEHSAGARAKTLQTSNISELVLSELKISLLSISDT